MSGQILHSRLSWNPFSTQDSQIMNNDNCDHDDHVNVMTKAMRRVSMALLPSWPSQPDLSDLVDGQDEPANEGAPSVIDVHPARHRSFNTTVVDHQQHLQSKSLKESNKVSLLSIDEDFGPSIASSINNSLGYRGHYRSSTVDTQLKYDNGMGFGTKPQRHLSISTNNSCNIYAAQSSPKTINDGKQKSWKARLTSKLRNGLGKHDDDSENHQEQITQLSPIHPCRHGVHIVNPATSFNQSTYSEAGVVAANNIICRSTSTGGNRLKIQSMHIGPDQLLSKMNARQDPIISSEIHPKPLLSESAHSDPSKSSRVFVKGSHKSKRVLYWLKKLPVFQSKQSAHEESASLPMHRLNVPAAINCSKDISHLSHDPPLSAPHESSSASIITLNSGHQAIDRPRASESDITRTSSHFAMSTPLPPAKKLNSSMMAAPIFQQDNASTWSTPAFCRQDAPFAHTPDRSIAKQPDTMLAFKQSRERKASESIMLQSWNPAQTSMPFQHVRGKTMMDLTDSTRASSFATQQQVSSLHSLMHQPTATTSRFSTSLNHRQSELVHHRLQDIYTSEQSFDIPQEWNTPTDSVISLPSPADLPIVTAQSSISSILHVDFKSDSSIQPQYHTYLPSPPKIDTFVLPKSTLLSPLHINVLSMHQKEEKEDMFDSVAFGKLHSSTLSDAFGPKDSPTSDSKHSTISPSIPSASFAVGQLDTLIRCIGQEINYYD
ncbi:hypothetical protein QVD99_003853 [Batrachochytrium dendrobatidis]|nr:hypothetical protein QVD99_003853 [Batrachochytrium dendrobatidis]